MKHPSTQIVRVLIVEDNQDDRILLLRQLQKIKVNDQVKFIADGREALDFLHSTLPAANNQDIIALFLDLKLPTMNGLDLLREIKAHPQLKEIPVIIMTSSNDPLDIEECQRLKVRGFISKPITFESFTKEVAEVFHLPASV